MSRDDQWRKFLDDPRTREQPGGGWFSTATPPDVEEQRRADRPPSDVETATRWFRDRGLRLDVGHLGDEAYVDVTDLGSGRTYGSYVRGADADEVAAEAARMWTVHHTRRG